MTQLQIVNLGEKINFFVDLTNKEKKILKEENMEFMKMVKRTAKLMAPRDTGSLAEDIQIVPVRRGKNVKVWKIFVDNPAAAPQEFGFEPHFAPILNSSKMAPGVYFVEKNTPFLGPAVEKNLSRYFQKLNEKVRGAIAK